MTSGDASREWRIMIQHQYISCAFIRLSSPASSYWSSTQNLFYNNLPKVEESEHTKPSYMYVLLNLFNWNCNDLSPRA